MWNYSFTIPSLLILAIIFCFYYFRPRLPIRINRTFLFLLTIDVFVVLFDWLSSHTDEFPESYHSWILWVLNLLFFAFFLLRIYGFFLFYMDILDLKVSDHLLLHRTAPILLALCELILISSPMTHAVFFIDTFGYHRGPLYNILYVCFGGYLLMAFILVALHRSGLSRYEFVSLLSSIMILVIGNIIRAIFPNMLIMDTFCMLSILVLFLTFQNPDRYLTDRGRAYNTKALRSLLNEWHPNHRYWFLGFAMKNYPELRAIFGGNQVDECIVQINQFLADSFPGALPFYLKNGCFTLVAAPSVSLNGVKETIQKRFLLPWKTSSGDLKPTLAFIQGDSSLKGFSADRLVNTLLVSMDSASRSASNEVHTLQDSMEKLERQMIVRRCLEKAIENDEVEVYLQPLVDCQTETVVAAEALARIREQNGDIIPPEEFISLAERDGQIVRLGEQVFRKVCAFLHEHQASFSCFRWINVNLSPLQCLQANLSDQFVRILHEFAISPSLIHFEITEQAMIDSDTLNNQMRALQKAGFQFALDDYGSGYSNLIRVSRYPFTNIKIDMSLVWSYAEHPSPLLPSMIQTFQEMHFSVTVEGIETREMADTFRELGCDFFQGYYYSPPIPMHDFIMKYGLSSEHGNSGATPVL